MHYMQYWSKYTNERSLFSECKTMNLDDILKKYRLPHSMHIEVQNESMFMFPLAEEARKICKQHGAEFTFVEGLEMQAGAIQDDIDIVVMYAGMFWMLCRLAAEITRGGAFINMNGQAEPTWNPDFKKSMQIPREILDEGNVFNWKIESADWNEHPERQMLFYAVLSILFRFVIFHEVGHLANDHVRRRHNDSAVPAILMDAPQQACEVEDPISSQAREIIADRFSLFRVIATLDHELDLKAETEMAQTLRKKLMATKKELIGFVLTVIFLYFRLSDRKDWKSELLKELSHPPSPFRMKALLATILENFKKLGISEKEAEQLINEVNLVGEAVISVTLNTYPDLDWLRSISTPEHDEHYNCIYHEIPKWHGRL